MAKGIFKAKKKDGTVYYRASMSRGGKKISLGSFDDPITASKAYHEAIMLYNEPSITIDNFESFVRCLGFEKCVSVINYRDNRIYMKTPIYLHATYISYFLKDVGELKFDREDLFYYSLHTIMSRGGHLFVNDYGSQYTLTERYGIMTYSVEGRDYKFVNGDSLDFRYQNILIINKYHGVRVTEKKTKLIYTAKIHINGEYTLGRFNNAVDAAICYNKGADLANEHGVEKNFMKNYISELSPEEYREKYDRIEVSKKFINYLNLNVNTFISGSIK